MPFNNQNRIAILTRGVIGGGVQKMSVNLANQLVVEGWEVDLLSMKKGVNPNIDPRVNIIVMHSSPNLLSRWYCYKAAPDLLKVIFLPVIIPLLFPRSLSYVKCLAVYMKNHRPLGLISATTYLNIAALLSRRLAKQNIRILISERTNLSGTINSMKNKFSLRWRFVPKLIEQIYPESDAIVAVSDGVGLDLAKISGLSKRKIRTINNPVITKTADNLENAQSYSRSLDKATPISNPHFVIVGRLVAVKRIDLAIRSFALYLKKTGIGRLTIVGDGPKKKKLEKLVERLNLTKHIVFTGWTDEPAKILQCADVCLLTSKREGSPNILVEAMHYGCQVVASNCPNGPKEILSNGAFGKLIDRDDAESISEAMIDIIENPIDKRLLLERSFDYIASKSAEHYLDSLSLRHD